MVVAAVLYYVLTVFLVLLFLRLIFEYVFLLARSFRPTGLVAMLLELIYTVTDPPLKALRRVLPPLRIGGVSLDLALPRAVHPGEHPAERRRAARRA